MTISVKDATGTPQTVSTLDDLIALVGAVTASPTANTLLARLKALQDNTDGLEGFTDGLEALIGATNTALATTNSTLSTLDGHVDGLEALITTLNGYVDQLEGFVDGLETNTAATNTKLDSIISASQTAGPLASANSTSVVPSTDGNPFRMSQDTSTHS